MQQLRNNIPVNNPHAFTATTRDYPQPPSHKHNNYKLFLGSLPKDCSHEAVWRQLTRYGEIDELDITVRDKTNKYSRGFGYVIVKSKQVFQRLLEAEVVVEGKTIFIEPYFSESKYNCCKNEEFMVKRIFISNIPNKLSDADIKEIFERFGKVDKAYRITTVKGKKRPFGFVLFNEKEAADACNAAKYVSYQGSKICCRHFKKEKPDYRQKQRDKKSRLVAQNFEQGLPGGRERDHRDQYQGSWSGSGGSGGPRGGYHQQGSWMGGGDRDRQAGGSRHHQGGWGQAGGWRKSGRRPQNPNYYERGSGGSWNENRYQRPEESEYEVKGSNGGNGAPGEEFYRQKNQSRGSNHSKNREEEINSYGRYPYNQGYKTSNALEREPVGSSGSGKSKNRGQGWDQGDNTGSSSQNDKADQRDSQTGQRSQNINAEGSDGSHWLFGATNFGSGQFGFQTKQRAQTHHPGSSSLQNQSPRHPGSSNNLQNHPNLANNDPIGIAQFSGFQANPANHSNKHFKIASTNPHRKSETLLYVRKNHSRKNVLLNICTRSRKFVAC